MGAPARGLSALPAFRSSPRTGGSKFKRRAGSPFSGSMGAAFPSMLDRLLSVLDAAVGAETVEAGRQALDEAFTLLGALYAALDPGRHPELTAYLQSAYDGCLRHIGEARPGRCDGLGAAITLLRHIQSAEAGARKSAGVADRPSFVGRLLAV